MKDSQEPIGQIAYARETKRKRDERSDIKARRKQMLHALWPHFIEKFHAEFREFVGMFNDGLRAKGVSTAKIRSSARSITATADRSSITIAGELDSQVLTMTYTTLHGRDRQTSDLPFYIRLGEDDQIEIHDSPDEARLIPVGAFLVRVLSPFFFEVVKDTR